ncbi:hypothetical protein L228DRAFT_249962 [Xylona heveae TC161]|uniref:Uncharacterized protein n=1 Tax=Xylona heveae (strain CBS 132557 / TC161) TaxID=1328760 RepID=A0A165ADC7_XYLHT|nr:hypothetical protein L228DRAFT_249962 [Xylona heveae TC161]KZF20291.1 hypothetical protein L228DRAFT_249962 [Xylona heveae TC161]
MAGRGLEQGLRSWRCSITPGQVRSFSSTPRCQKHGAIPSFSPTSSPELDALLAQFRSKVFLPSHLLKRQRDLVYKEKYRSLVSNDPVMVTIGDEKFQLEHIDRTKDEPSSQQGFAQLLDLMKEPGDWKNLPGFLEGMHTAKRKLKKHQMEKMVRRANMIGRQGVIVDCVQRVGTTGLALTSANVVREIMLGTHLEAQESEWDEQATLKALTHAEQIVSALEDPKHIGKQPFKTAHIRSQPAIIGVVLELAAVRAVKHLDGKDVDGKVATYAGRLMATWNDANLTPRETWQDANRQLLAWVPVQNALKATLKVLDSNSEVAVWAQKVLPQVNQALEQAAEMVRQKEDTPRRGLNVYEAVERTV